MAFFSATLPEAAEELARSLLAAPVRVTVGERGGAAPSVAQRLVYVGAEAGRRLALREMLAAGLAPPVLVFVASQQRAAALHECAPAPSACSISCEHCGARTFRFRSLHAAALLDCPPIPHSVASSDANVFGDRNAALHRTRALLASCSGTLSLRRQHALML